MLSSARNPAATSAVRTALFRSCGALPSSLLNFSVGSNSADFETNPKKQNQIQIRPMTVLSKKSAEEYKKFNFSERASATGRPVSPHVTIYSFPIGALTSIVNRATGCALSVGAAGLGAAELLGGSGTALDVMSAIGEQGGVITAAGKFAVAFPFVYHYLGGLRHLAWDQMPTYLTNDDVDKASYVLAGSSLLISLGLVVV